MYNYIDWDAKLICYYQGILSQYSHGLFLSNIIMLDSEHLQKVLFESIPLADRIIQGICRTFPQKEMLEHFLHSDSFKTIINSQGFNQGDLLNFAKAVIKKDKSLYS